jgi:hypothetical protein
MGLFSGSLYAKSPPTWSNSSAYVFRSLSFGRVFARTYSFCIRVIRFEKVLLMRDRVGRLVRNQARGWAGSSLSSISVSTSEEKEIRLREEIAWRRVRKWNCPARFGEGQDS